MLGKIRRLKRIFREDQRTVIVPMDHGVTVGPIAGIVNMQDSIDHLLEGQVDAVVLHKGIARCVDTGLAGLIVHLSGNTNLGTTLNNKVQVCSVKEALRTGADAVSVHINIGANQEDQMFSKLGKVTEDCDDFGMPLLAMVYPRGPKITNEHDADVIAHAVRLAAELGSDIVKTNYTGDFETFRKAIEGCPVPVVVAGGPKVETNQEILQMAFESTRAGCSGLSIGRNVFQHKNPALMVKALSAIVHQGASVEVAMKILGEPNEGALD